MIRELKNTPGYALSIVLTLGLGLGATTAILAVVDSVLLHPLAMPGADHVDTIWLRDAEGRQEPVN